MYTLSNLHGWMRGFINQEAGKAADLHSVKIVIPHFQYLMKVVDGRIMALMNLEMFSTLFAKQTTAISEKPESLF